MRFRARPTGTSRARSPSPAAPPASAPPSPPVDGTRLATGQGLRRDRRACRRADLVLLDEAGAAGLVDRLTGRRFAVAVGGGEALPAQPVRAVHDLDPAAGGRPQAALHRPAHHAGGPEALRERLHHLHAHRLHDAVGDGPDRGPRARLASCTARTTCPTRPAATRRRSRTPRRPTRPSARRATRSARPTRSAPELGADERALYELDLEAHRRLADGRRPGRDACRSASGPPRRTGRGRRVRAPAARTIVFPGFLRAYVEGADDPTPTWRTGRSGCPALAEGDALAVAVPGARGPRDQAAGPLHRGVAGEGARGAGRRPAVDLRLHHRHHPGPGLRLEEGHGPGADVHRVRRRHPARAALPRPGRLRLHRPHGGRPRRHRRRRARSGSRGSSKFYFGNGDRPASRRW